jgi:nitronate monooxygenase
VPLIVAPRLRISGLELVKAVCAAGVAGAFPTINARTPDGLDSWLTDLEKAATRGSMAPRCMPKVAAEG